MWCVCVCVCARARARACACVRACVLFVFLTTHAHTHITQVAAWIDRAHSSLAAAFRKGTFWGIGVCAWKRDFGECAVACMYRFSNVLSIVTSHRKYTRVLRFENFCQVGGSARDL
jgi:hypothetical protein